MKNRHYDSFLRVGKYKTSHFVLKKVEKPTGTAIDLKVGKY
ncbi:hypothetical protein M23134_00432 [Microscilla marina ATCC 23134]|uniref:Uncharacterized protein n=1 Tax=Microscilla marina ATCC 23134 TaxID=313606 RepID=A1ZJ13_MICM2|nr:hypothetical protein M23134_00432 [Microscilla marina ATCC 23134]